jgi:hypothetical protein
MNKFYVCFLGEISVSQITKKHYQPWIPLPYHHIFLILHQNTVFNKIYVLHRQKNYYNVHHINIEGWEKETIIYKKNHILSSTWNLLFKLIIET